MLEHRNDIFSVQDGYFFLDFREDGIYLTVYAPKEDGKSVNIEDVIDRLNKSGIKQYNKEAIEQSIKSQNQPVKIGDNVTSSEPEVLITTNTDNMKAYITLGKSLSENNLDVNSLIKQLNEEGITFGIKQNVLEDLVKNPVYNKSILVAEGTKPVDGVDGKIHYNFHTKKEFKPIVLNGGKVDFRNLNIIQNVAKGQVLCTLTPPGKGIPGKNIKGEIIEARKGKEVKLKRGKNTEISEDGLTLKASIDGQIVFRDGKVSVLPTYEVPADVDNSTGNIKFVGNVIVRGNVLSGFEIEAGGFVEVWGVVEAAVIKAGSDIIIRRGMHGSGKGMLISGGDIVSSYIEHSIVDAKNNIQAEAIMHSKVRCGNKLELSGRNGLLVGGVTRAGKEISAKVIGSPMATLTEIEVGLEPHLKERYKDLRAELNSIRNDLKKTSQLISLLQKLQSKGPLPSDKNEMLGKSIRTRIILNSRINEIKSEIAYIENIMNEETKGTINVYNIIHPGVNLSIGTCRMTVYDKLQYCTLYRDGADIKVGPLRS